MPPKDVLGLGRHLVRELNLEDGVDTLGRWMAHHIAELLAAAENEKTAARQERARRRAEEAILRVWEHRAAMPGNAFPLRPYRDVIAVLERLRPGSRPFGYAGFGNPTEREGHAIALFDTMALLVIVLLMMKLSDETVRAGDDAVAVDAMSPEEQQVLAAIRAWDPLFESLPVATKSGRRSASRKRGQIDLVAEADRLIGSAMSRLDALRISLRKAT